MLVQQRQHEAQQVKLAHMQEFVDKFRYNAKRASLVQSRIKMIEKEDVIADVEDEKPFEFWFADAGEIGRPVIQLDDVTFGYSPDKILFEHVMLDVDLKSRVALVGPNGVGKSTVLNLVQGKLTALNGFIKINPQLRLGVFTQHHMDSFDLVISPLQNMMNRWPKATDAELRAHLGRYEVTGNDALKPMKFMSGGQKSRVAFAALTFSKPHVVILDEPTNHLDMEAIEALANALIDFKGGVVVISHDQYFIEKVCSEIWIVGNKTVKIYKGTFEDYKRSIIG
jgi:ATP-binding cassette subfamily F protein 3